MTDEQATALRTRRRATALVLVLAASTLVLVAAARAVGGPVPWTSWALPLVLLANVGILQLSVAGRSPWLTRALTLLSIIAVLSILASLILSNAHRFT